MLVSLIAVCLMVAVEGYNRMDDRFPERHGMHRDPHFYGPAYPASYNQGPFYDRHDYDEPTYDGPCYTAHNNGFQSHMRSDYESNHYPNECSRRNMDSDGCPMNKKSANRNSEKKSRSDHKNFKPDNHEH